MDDADAADLSDTAYQRLRVLARSRLRDGGRNTLLDTTVLVHEAYLRMGGVQATVDEQRRFLAYASKTMRSVIVDTARRRQAERRGGDACVVTLTDGLDQRAPAGADQIVRVHDALLELESIDPRLAQVVEMRFFAGLGDAEIGCALAVSERTVRRDWEKARHVLALALRG
ncbi:ECF-type sigma factor [Ideonella sp. A 288]|uniref:ECF-type sigma factor n=1 Tax=Ideonella sp. A 288 TaxID=1962181 RepID=UPI000B4B7748|nr:ECF-type sigma factor [Ideonella sp. A 288]